MTEMKSDKQATGKLVVTDRLGKPTKLSDVVVASSDETVVIATWDPATSTILAKGVTAGTARVVASGDASVDAGLQPFEASEDFSILQADVVSGSLTFDAPVDQ
jgi:hypothetical protein